MFLLSQVLCGQTENELLPLNVWKRRPYRIKITGKKRQYHLATSERAGARAGTGWGAAHSHSWDISNHNCEWHPAVPFWDQVPPWMCPLLCLQAAELQLKHGPLTAARAGVPHRAH